jgi:hypothetical protein
MTERREVPCDGCRACCVRERIILSPQHGDDQASYITVPTRQGDGPVQWMLAHKLNGECVYLGERGCTIHDRAPWACRQFDCRRWLAGFPDALQELLLPDDLDGQVLEAARLRLLP